MKPNFALTLSFEGIGLLHRAFPGWHLVGEIDLDNPDLLGDLRELRDMAEVLDPAGVYSKLVIPNDQIKYLDFDAGNVPADDIPALVESALQGATPYALDELAYDWVCEDDTVQVAAVARETLREAQAFAADHGFNPICFVASPTAGDFSGEPFFGETDLMADLCDPGESVERDPVPVRIIGTAKLPDPQVESTEEARLETPAEISAEASVEAPAEFSEENSDEPEIDTPPVIAFSRAAKAPPVVEMNEPPAIFEPEVAEEPTPEAPDTDASAEIGAPADDAQDGSEDPGTSAEPAPTAAFTSIRAVREGTTGAAPKLDGVARQFTPVPVSADVVSDSLPVDPDDTTQAPEPDVAADTAPDLRREPPVTDTPVVDPPAIEAPVIPPAPPEYSPAPSTGHSGFATARTGPVAEPRPQPSPANEEQRMTIFGAREGQDVGGKPKHLALILTAVLLLFLAGVAAWASLFLDDGLAGFFRDEPEVITADVPAVPDVPTDSDAAAPTPEADVASLPAQDAADVEGALREALRPPEPEPLSEDEALARYAATGIWQIAPVAPQTPEIDGLDDFYQTSIDRDVTIEDAVAIPDVATLQAEPRPETPTSPASADTTYDLDDRGFVRATPQGALTPDGIRIFAGQPPIRPAAMPKRVIVEEVLQDAPPDADPALAESRPAPRPDDLEEQNERETLSGRTRAELAGFRPRIRPDTIRPVTADPATQDPDTELAAAETQPTPFIDLDAVNSAVTEAVESDAAFISPTPQAVASSLKPNTRPRDFATTVARSTAVQEAVPVSAAQRVSPRIPTATSVAKQATERNAIRLRKINLIGVYGAPNARRALVRMSNGRYRKVKVGDRLDGGKVSAIGNSELRYQKSGRSVVLKMPKG